MSDRLTQFLSDLQELGLPANEQQALIASHAGQANAELDGPQVEKLVEGLVRQGRVTDYQASLLVAGRGRELRLENYLLLEKLGEGGMGTVYKAVHIFLHRTVAIKTIRRSIIDTYAIQRFQQEIEALGRLNHPHIVRAAHAGEATGVRFLVMEFVPGMDLTHVCCKRGQLSAGDACEIARQTAVGLQYIHQCGLVHRDIKPSNLMLTVEGTVRILDLGLARFHRNETQDRRLTAAGQILGTVDYIAPEQATGDVDVDIRADIYSLGCTLFRLLTGQVPYCTTRYPGKMERILAHIRDPFPALQALRPDLPASLAAVLQRMVEKLPAARFPSPGDVELALRPFCNGSNLPALLHTSHPDAPATLTLPRAPNLHNTPLSVPSLSPRFIAGTAWHKTMLPLVAISAFVCLLVVSLKIANRVEMIGDKKAVKGSEVEMTTVNESSDNKVASESPEALWHGWPSEAPSPAISPFDARNAKKLQDEWAAFLKVPVNYNNSIGMDFVLIPPGEFLMGSTPSDIEWALQVVGQGEYWQALVKNEAPQHKVVLTQPIYLGIHEVTQAQYAHVMGNNPSHFARTGPGKDAVAGMETSRHPVDTVSWNDAADYCSKLSEQETLEPCYISDGEKVTRRDGNGYRLPTSAEWEFACRAGTTSRYWIGDRNEDLAQAGWFNKNSRDRTHAVGELKGNPFGLYDLHGNVWEWVQDWWEPDFYSQIQNIPALNPDGPSFSNNFWRVIRGGNCFHPASTNRASVCNVHDPASRTNDLHHIGFRLSLSVAGVKSAIAERTKKRAGAAPDRTPAEQQRFEAVSAKVPRFIKASEKIEEDYQEFFTALAEVHNEADIVRLLEQLFLTAPRDPSQRKIVSEKLASFAETATKRGKANIAMRVCESGLKYDSNSVNLHFMCGTVNQSRGEFDQAIAEYDETLRLDPRSAAALKRRGHTWFLKRDYDKAIADYDGSLRLDPNDEVVFCDRARAREAKKEYNKAIADYDGALRINPKSADAYGARGSLWSLQNEYDKAIADFSEALRLYPDSWLAFIKRGDAWYAKKNFDNAIADFTQAIRLDSNSASAFNLRGNAWLAKKDYDRSIADYGEALRLNPNHEAIFYLNRGLAWQFKKGYDQATADFDEAIRLNPKHANSFGCRARLHAARMENTKALGDFEEATGLEPSHFVQRAYAEFLASCSDVSFRDGQRAVELARQAITLAGVKTSWRHHSALAAALAEFGDFEQAVATQKIALADASLDDEDRAEMQSRLGLYQLKKPLRLP